MAETATDQVTGRLRHEGTEIGAMIDTERDRDHQEWAEAADIEVQAHVATLTTICPYQSELLTRFPTFRLLCSTP